jgi:hypothetical protein
MLERLVSAATLTACVFWAAYLVVFGSDAGLPFFPVLIVLVWGGVAVVVLWVLRVLLHLALTRHSPERRRVGRLLAEPVVLFLCVAFVWSGAAFWLRFMFSRPSLNSYVAHAREARLAPFRPGVRVGLFWLRDAEVLPQGEVRMITTACGVVDSCGLVYSPAGMPPVLGEDVYDSLGGPWYHWYWRF